MSPTGGASMSQRLDDLVTSTEHAEPVHPLKILWQQNFYLDGFVNTEGGLALMWMDALLVVPLIMAAFFYPWAALAVAAVVLGLSFVGYEGWVIWKHHHRA
jgi:hypothetical protein